MKKATIYAGLLIGAASLVALPLHAAPPSGGEETAAQNLSVPAILVGSLGSLVCGTVDNLLDLVPPPGLGDPPPLTDYEVPGFYWVQKVHTWQAQCFEADEAKAFASWGDNLGGDANLKVGSPIRVELVLTNMDDYSATIPDGLQGYTVIKLEPSQLDRVSAYGHEAIEIADGWGSTPTTFTQAQWLVHNQGITFSVLNQDTGAYAVEPGTSPTAEINATGKIVYGYNLRVSTAGNYRIQFTTTPAVTLTGTDEPEDGGLIDANNVYIDIVVTAGGGGGGGGGSGGPGGGGGGGSGGPGGGGGGGGPRG